MNYQEAIEYMRKESRKQCVNSEGQDAYIIAISALQELQEYKKFGTLEEIREAMERKKALEPSPMLGIFGKVYECKECGNELEMHSMYCPFCGQKQNWSEEP